MIDGELRKLFREHLPQVHWQAIETGGTGRGIPDSNGCYMGCEFWVEYKLTTGWIAGLRPEQVGWIYRRYRAGGRVWVAIRRKTLEGVRRGVAVDQLWMFHGKDVRKLDEGGLRAVIPLATFEGGPGGWDWPMVLQILTR